jgi:hypothetical protein
MRGNITLAVLTLVVALFLLVPALVAGWHSDKKAQGRAGSDSHGAGRRPKARRPLTGGAPLNGTSPMTPPAYPTHSVRKITPKGD